MQPQSNNPNTPFPLLPGELNLLVGHPGTGKSLLSLDLASRISRGTPLPPLPDAPASTPGDIIYLSAEYHNDSAHLLAAGIPQNRLCQPEPHFASLVPPKRRLYPDETPIAPLFEYLNELIRVGTLPNPRLLILDPLHAYTGAITASASTLRDTLLPLTQFAHDQKCAVLGISHLAKFRALFSDAPLNQVLGNIAFTAYARSILLLARDPDDPNRRLLTHLKNNKGPLSPTLAFTIQSRALPENHNPDSYLPPLLLWQAIDASPGKSRAIQPDLEPEQLKKSQLHLACNFLQESLKDGPQPSQLIIRQARALAISCRTLERARLQLGVPCYPKDRQWLMSLPKEIPDHTLEHSKP